MLTTCAEILLVVVLPIADNRQDNELINHTKVRKSKMSKKTKKSRAAKASASAGPPEYQEEPPIGPRKQPATGEASPDLDGLPGLTYLFVSDDEAEIGPDDPDAIVLGICSVCPRPYPGPFGMSSHELSEANGRRAEIVAAVKKHVKRLHKSGASFVLLWQAFGELAPHFDYSEDHDTESAAREIWQLMESALESCFDPGHLFDLE